MIRQTTLAGAPWHAYYGHCTCCGHCKPCPVKRYITLVNKYYDLAEMQDKVPDTLRAHYSCLEVGASRCIGCKSCESRCPFGVSIAEQMRKAAQLFG